MCHETRSDVGNASENQNAVAVRASALVVYPSSLSYFLSKQENNYEQ
jgi:hypothetical protein